MTQQRATRPDGNLPLIASSFVGRQVELGELKRRMESARLVTLTGPGGVGKTRLALQAGGNARRAFPGGVWFVDLAALHEPFRIADAVAVVLGVNDQSVHTGQQQLVHYLQGRQLLIVLDNCEHLITECAQLADTLLRAAPGLWILATSRQALGIVGEHVLPVEPLASPDPHGVPAADVLGKYDAVALLVDRATAVEPAFCLQEGNRDAIARLCARLDGLPLAIELAATRLRALSIEQLADRLDDRFSLLNRGSPAALSRQQTLRALIDWSYDLCTEREQLLWAILSVFPGEFDLTAVEGICTDPDIGLPPEFAVDVIDELVAKSIISARRDLSPMRYRLLETIRQYGQERLDGRGLGAAVRTAHRDYYLGLARLGSQSWCGPCQSEILTRLRVEQDNLMAALSWSLAHLAGHETALQLIYAMRHHFLLGDFRADRWHTVESVLHRVVEPTAARADALWVASVIALIQGDREAAAAWMQECIEIASSHPSDRIHGYIELFYGALALFDGACGAAVRHYEAGLKLARAAGDTEVVLWGTFQYSFALTHCGRTGEALGVCAEAIELAESRHEHWGLAQAKWANAFTLWLTGEHERAAELTREATDLTPNANHVATVLDIELLAWIAASDSRFDEAGELLGAAAELWDSLGTTIDAFGPLFVDNSRQCRQRVIRAVGESRFAELLSRGRSQRLDTHVDSPASLRLLDPEVATENYGLTPRELEVAQLIARGMTNKAIAEELVLSRRTIDGYVERLFAKLDVSARAQVAVWVTQHHLELAI